MSNDLRQLSGGVAEYTASVAGPIDVRFDGFRADVRVIESSRPYEASVRIEAITQDDETYEQVRKFHLDAGGYLWSITEPEPPSVVIGGGSVILGGIDGDVTISGRTIRFSNGGGSVIQVGNGMFMGSSFGGSYTQVGGTRMDIAVTIAVPAGGHLTISTHNGRVAVDAATDDLAIKTHNGPIAVEGSADRASLNTHNGPITVRQVRRLAGSSHNGSIRVAELREHAEVSSHNGLIEVHAAEGYAPRVDARTHNADIQTYGVGRLSTRTHNGRVYES